jgi:hypothetical protein
LEPTWGGEQQPDSVQVLVVDGHLRGHDGGGQSGRISSRASAVEERRGATKIVMAVKTAIHDKVRPANQLQREPS